MKNRLFAVIVVFGIQLSCDTPSSPGNTALDITKQDTITLGDNTFVLRSFLYRDYMPSIQGDTGGSALIGSVSICDIHGDSITEDFGADSLWISNAEINRQIAITGAEKRDSLVECTFQDGIYDIPTGILVTVVLRIQYLNNHYYLRQKDAHIWKTE